VGKEVGDNCHDDKSRKVLPWTEIIVICLTILLNVACIYFLGVLLSRRIGFADMDLPTHHNADLQ